MKQVKKFVDYRSASYDKTNAGMLNDRLLTSRANAKQATPGVSMVYQK